MVTRKETRNKKAKEEEEYQYPVHSTQSSEAIRNTQYPLQITAYYVYYEP
jgi:hypothetical protein